MTLQGNPSITPQAAILRHPFTHLDTHLAAKLVSLRNMLDDEITDIHSLLEENEIEYYETPGGLMGLGSPVIWLRDKENLKPAKDLLARYNEQRQQRVRAEYEAAKAKGEVRTIKDEIRENPLRFVTYLAFAVFLIWIMMWPFWG